MDMRPKPADSCRWDCLALGEVMLRFDPEWGRIRTTRHFRVSEGGGEYNVARALSKVFGMRTSVVTALVDNEVGHLIEDLMMTGGVDLSQVKWVPHDGIGLDARVGLNFTEKGFGIRPALGVSDRANSAASQLKPGDVDWARIFEKAGVRWLHTGGIFAALSESTAAVALEAMEAARRADTIVSYDLNYRPSLWKARGGQGRAMEVNRALAPHVDVMIGNEEDFTAALGFAVPDLDEEITNLDPSAFKAMIGQVLAEFAISGWSLPPFGMPRRLDSTIGVRFCTPMAHFTRRECARISRSTTGWWRRRFRQRDDLGLSRWQAAGGGCGSRCRSRCVDHATPGDTSMVTSREVLAQSLLEALVLCVDGLYRSSR